MLFVGSYHVIHGEGEVKLTFTEVVGLCAVLYPCELQLKIGSTVTEEGEVEAAVGSLFFAYRFETESLTVELYGAFKVENIEIEVIEAEHFSLSLSEFYYVVANAVVTA